VAVASAGPSANRGSEQITTPVCLRYEIAGDEHVTATAREVTEGPGQGALPVYQLHYAVFYNASAAAEAEAEATETANFTVLRTSTIVPDGDGGGQKASNACARHYAETLLIRLFTLQSWLNEQCSVEQSPPSPRVLVHTIVVVRVYGPLVSIRRSRNPVIGQRQLQLQRSQIYVRPKANMYS